MFSADPAARGTVAGQPRRFTTPRPTTPVGRARAPANGRVLRGSSSRPITDGRLALSYYGAPVPASADKARQELGWPPCLASAPIVAAGKSMIKHGIIVRRRR